MMPNGNPPQRFMPCTFDLIWQADKCDFGRGGLGMHTPVHTDREAKYVQLSGRGADYKKIRMCISSLSNSRTFLFR